jgi:hypothetical protein
MHDKHLFEFAVIRVVPRVEREEFVNVGVVVFCKRKRFLKAAFVLDPLKLHSLSPETDVVEVEENLRSFISISEGAKKGGPIAQMDPAERFRWLTAVRSTVIQTSRPHPGFGSDLDSVLSKLLSEQVL